MSASISISIFLSVSLSNLCIAQMAAGGGSGGGDGVSNTEPVPTQQPSCQLIAGKMVCSFHNSLLRTPPQLNFTRSSAPQKHSTPLPLGPEPGSGSTEKPDSDSHVDLVDDLSKFFTGSGRSKSVGGPVVSPELKLTTGTPPSSQYLTTTPSDRMYVTPMVVRGEKGETGPPGQPGVCPQRCSWPDSEVRVLPSGSPGPANLKGDKGEAGRPGAPGSDGAAGECRPDQCAADAAGAKGERGPVGPQGPPGPVAPQGPPGPVGPQGPPGKKGEPGDVGGNGGGGGGGYANAVRELVRSEVLQLRRGPKGEKGDPGACGAGCGGSGGGRSATSGGDAAPGQQAAGGSGVPGQAIASTSVRVLRTYQLFTDIGYAFEEGTLVFTKDEKILYLKVDYRLNQWIEVANYIAKPKIQLGFPPPTTSPRLGPLGPEDFRPYVVTGKKIRLVALPMKLHGDLYYKSASSILGADYACHDAAMEAGLSRSYFKVFLNGQYNNLDTIVHASQRSDVPIVNFYGQKLFSSFTEMLSRGAWNKEVQLQDFSGRNLSQWREHYGLPELLAWQGLRQSQRQADVFSQDCEGFTNRDPVKLGYVTDLASGRLFQSREITCESQQLVLCIEAFDENAAIVDPMDYRRRR